MSAVLKRRKDVEPPEVPEAEQNAVSALQTEIGYAKSRNKSFFEDSLPGLRKLVYGVPAGKDDNSESDVRTNLILATLSTLLPHIYAKNPEIAVTPTEAVEEQEYETIKKFCKTAQVMLDRCFLREAQLKKRAKSNVRSAMGTSVGWIKMQMQESLTGDPVVIRRVNDLQDNLQRIEHLIVKADKETDTAALNVQREELKRQIAAVHSGSEVKTFKGFVLDRVLTEDVLILDAGVKEFDDYVHARKLAHGIWMSKDAYSQAFRKDPGPGAKTWGPGEAGSPDQSGIGETPPDKEPKTAYLRIWEVWDKTCNTVFTVCEGEKGWAKAPFIPKNTAERWYPLFCLGFNLVEGRWRPLSDVELLRKLQDEYNTTRYLFAETRKEAIPVRIFRKAGNLTVEDIKELKDRKVRSWIGIEGNPATPLDQDIMQLAGVEIDPEAYDVTLIRNDMDMMVGLSDASRSNLIEAKTATEAEIMRQALMTRVAERQDSNEDFISEMAVACLQIMLRRFTQDEVRQICGQGAVWPGESLTVDEIFHKCNIQVRAGSTGKPNLQKEREQWTNLLPVLNETITQVAELRVQGQMDMANSKIELLKETLRRYDERIDVDAYIPRMAEGDQKQQEQQMLAKAAQAVAQMEDLQKQAQQAQEALKACQDQLLKCEQSLTLAKQNDQEKAAKVQADSVITQAQESSRASEQQAKQAEHERAAAEAAAKEQAKVTHDIELANIEADHKEELARIQEEAETSREEKRLASQEKIAQISAGAKIATAPPLKSKTTEGTDGVDGEPGTPGTQEVEKKTPEQERLTALMVDSIAQALQTPAIHDQLREILTRVGAS